MRILLAGAVAACAALATAFASPAAVASSPPPLPSGPGVHGPVAGPAGWQPADFDNARIWVPPTWNIAFPGSQTGCGSPGVGTVLLGDASVGPGTTCSPLVTLRTETPVPAGATSTEVNGYQVLESGDSYWVPALDVTITESGDVPAAVVGHLGPSPEEIVTGSGSATPVDVDSREVSWHGVHLIVPAWWPTASGALTGPCFDPFVAAAVYEGPYTGPALPCPFLPREYAPADGVWLQVGTPAGQATEAVRTPAGQILRLAADNGQGPLVQLWYHGLSILIGVGKEPLLERAVFDTIGWHPGAGNTPVADACPTFIQHRMPTSANLSSRVVLNAADDGGYVLTPPLSTDAAASPAAAAWRQSGHVVGVRYQIWLARMSAEEPQVNGHPEYQDVLVWAVYGVPHVTALGGCNVYSVNFFDAHSGAQLFEDTWPSGRS